MSVPVIDPAIASLIIFGLCIIGFLANRFPMAVTAILGCAVMVILGVADFSAVFGTFASSSVALVISMMIVGEAMAQVGLTQAISGNLVKLCKGSERRFLLGLCALCALVSAFMSNVATLALFIPVAESYCKDNNRDVRYILLPLAMACQIGGGCTLMGSAPQLVAQGMVEDLLGKGFGFFEFGHIGIVLVAVLLLYIAFVGYPSSPRIWKNSTESTNSNVNIRSEMACSESKRSKLPFMAVLFVATCILFYFEPIPLAVIAISAALICVLAGCIDHKKVASAVSWSVVGKLGGCLGLVQALKKSGGLDLMSEAVDRFLPKDLSSYTILILVSVVTMFISDFLANSTALMITLPPAMAICAARGFNPYAFAMAITLASNALSTPLSATPLMMIMGDRYRFSDYIRYALPYDLLQLTMILLLVPVLYPL